MGGSVFIESNTFSIPKVETGCYACKWRIKLRSILPGSVVDCIEVNIDFSERIFINEIGLYSDRLYRCNY